jgi:hypothetical protein
MLSLIFTLDYEIHGNGEGCPFQLMVEPTDRLLILFDEYGAKLTIMADVAEIIRFKEHAEEAGRDEFHYAAIVQQLHRAMQSRHDVQLHVHPSYLNARYDNGRWIQDWSEYNFSGLPQARMEQIVRTCKDFLETSLCQVEPSYRCLAFRAANWSVSPSRNVFAALVNNGIEIDTSVFKYGLRQGLVSFDYSSAAHPLLPWRASQEDFCRPAATSPLWEFPIYAEKRWVGSFLTPHRVYRSLLGRLHRISDAPATGIRHRARGKTRKWSWLFQKHAWKADFNQCSGRQLVRSLIAAEKLVAPEEHAPFVLIGHSKLFTRWNERSLRPLLAFVRKHPNRFGFSTLSQFGERLLRQPRFAESAAYSQV